MKKVEWHLQPQHGLQVEETIAAGDRDGVEHLVRYWTAWTLARDRKASVIWDLGCGCGYGSYILAAAEYGNMAHRVTGFDAGKMALNCSLRDYGGTPNLVFQNYFLEGDDWSLSDDSYQPDLIVAFQLIEWLKHRDLFFERLVTAIAPDGLVMLNFAEPDRESADVNPPARGATGYFRYDHRTAERLLHRYFKIVTSAIHLPYTAHVNDLIASYCAKSTEKVVQPYRVGPGTFLCKLPII